MTEACPFCEIVSGDSDTAVLAEWEAGLAFAPLEPATPGHTLVVPRQHVTDIWELPQALAAELSRYVLQVATAIKDSLRPAGLNIINSAGEAATQTVMHLHVHLVPRYETDEMGEIWPTRANVSQEVASSAFMKISQAISTSS